MNVIPHDPDREPERRPEFQPDEAPLVFTPFRTLVLRTRQELRVDLSERAGRRAVSVRLWTSAGRGRGLAPERPWHLFPAELPAVIAALTEAAIAIGVPLPSAPGHHVDTGGATLPPFVTGRERGAVDPGDSHA